MPDADGRAPYVTVNKNNYHSACVKCQTCGVLFGGGEPGPFLVNGKILCKKDASKEKKVKELGIYFVLNFDNT